MVGVGTEAEAAEAPVERARALDDAQRPADAAAVYRTLATRYPKREVAGAALWRLGWIAYLKGDAREAAQTGRGSAIPGGPRASRPCRALLDGPRATEEAAVAAAAAPLYAQVIAEAPRSYYGMLALRGGRPWRGAGRADAPSRLPADPADAVASDPGLRARRSAAPASGWSRARWRSSRTSWQRSVGDTVRLYGLTSAYVRDERYHLALRILRRHFAALAASGDRRCRGRSGRCCTRSAGAAR